MVNEVACSGCQYFGTAGCNYCGNCPFKPEERNDSTAVLYFFI